MPQINQLASLSQVSGADQIPVYNTNNGDARKMSVNALLQYFQTTFAAPTVSTNLFTPGTGFNITVPTPVADQQWMILQPAGTLATGAITLPLNTGVPDGTEVLITSTQTVTAFTLALNGAAQIFGNVSTLTAGAAVRYRYYLATNSWYNITNETGGTSLSTTGNQVISGTGKQGYAVGAGGGVLQATSKSTTVVLDKSCGQITMDAAALAASTTVTFTLTNSTVEAGDVIVMNHITGGTLGAYTLNASTGIGTANINVRNVTLGALSEAIVLRFAVIKVVDA